MISWQTDIIETAILYGLLEDNVTIPFITDGTPYEFIDENLHELKRKRLLENDGIIWQVSSLGRDRYDDLIGLYDELAPFDVFGEVDLGKEVDLRLAMLDFLTHLSRQSFAGEKLVFLQKLAADEIQGATLWFDLKMGTLFSELKDICESQPKWRDLGASESEAEALMKQIYVAGISDINLGAAQAIVGRLNSQWFV